jgi:thioredoxin 1
VTTELTKDTFNDFVTDNTIGLIDFWAAWCGPCRSFAPVFESAAARNPDIGFGKVNTEDQPELAGAFEIMSIPTLIAFKEGAILYAQPGALPEEALDDLIRQIREVDMEELRKQAAEEEAPVES